MPGSPPRGGEEGSGLECVLMDSDPTPASDRRLSSGSGRQAKKTAGRKAGSKTVVSEVAGSVSALGGDLGAALVASGPAVKAKRTRATPVSSRAPSARAKAKLGDMTSLESAKLRAADKNMDTTGNLLPSFKILNAFSDEHLAEILHDSGVALDSSSLDLISLLRAREEAQAALAEAAARCAAAQAVEATDAASVGADVVDMPMEGAEAEAASVLPSSSRKPARKRVAKAVSSRGVRLRNRII